MAKLYFYYSAMNAGKSTLLLQANYNYLERGMQTLIFTPAVDTRFQSNAVHSRIGIHAPAVSVSPSYDLLQHVQEYYAGHPKLACVLVDEAQFVTKAQVMQLTRVVDELNLPVLTYGLRTDFRGEPFAGSQYLLAWADELVEVKTICHCGQKAIMSMRIDAEGKQVTDGAQVQIGGNDLYVSTCRAHYFAGISGCELSAPVDHTQASVD